MLGVTGKLGIVENTNGGANAFNNFNGYGFYIGVQYVKGNQMEVRKCTILFVGATGTAASGGVSWKTIQYVAGDQSATFVHNQMGTINISNLDEGCSATYYIIRIK